MEEEEARAQGRVAGRRRSQGDWRCLGYLAERLMQLPEAEMAYRNCVRETFQAQVWERLMWMYTEAHYMNEPIICAAQLCNYHVLHFHESVDVSKELPPLEVQKALSKIVAHAGMRRVRKAFADAATGNLPEMMVSLLDSFTAWRIHNFDG